jgi:2-keto-4-pentenoate hydratase/2-oxohepta-3-ene-1,7-dioic acid hydratase in catechol pathway
MRVVRYLAGDDARYGVVDGDVVRALDGDPTAPADGGAVVGELDGLELLAPCEPTKVVAVGRNYASHVQEMNAPWPTQPLLFLKGPNTVIGPGQAARRPAGVERFDYEGELAVVIGRRASGLRPGDLAPFVWGYTCGNDLTIRDWQDSDGQWARVKGADTLCPLGPWIETEIAEPGALGIRTSVNGEVRQEGHTSDLIFDIGTLLAFITEHITLEPGDVVLTGTPGGVGPLVSGDVVEVEVEQIGRLRTPIRDAAQGRA